MVCDQSAGILLGREIRDLTDEVMKEPVVVTDCLTADTGSLLTVAKVVVTPINPTLLPLMILEAGVMVTARSGMLEPVPFSF